jgi:glutamate--cysteine ligase
MAMDAAPVRDERLTRDDLVAEYFRYGVPRERFRLGGEFERHLLRPDGTPVPYFGEHGVLWLMERFAERGWEPYREDGWPIALFRGPTSITLEPGGQFELSGAPFDTASEVVAQARDFAAEIDEIVGDAPIRQVALGYTPYARIDEVGWVPKGRYGVMQDYLARRGDLAHHMMKGTAAVQASFDFEDEADAAAKVRLAVRLGPLTTALFANSPLVAGAPSGFQSWRGHVWTRTDPDRTGFPEAAVEFSFERWVDYLLDVPMIFTRVGGAGPTRGAARSGNGWSTASTASGRPGPTGTST